MQKLIVLFLLIRVFFSGPCLAQDDSQLKAIFVKQAQDYAGFFKSKDAEAIANMFQENGEMTLPDGITLVGRAHIKKYLKEYFDEAKTEPVKVEVTGVKELVPDKFVMQTGSTTVVGNTKPSSSYKALNIKEDGKWKIAWVEERIIPPSHSLDDVKWMVGVWRPNIPNLKPEDKVEIKKIGHGNFIHVSNKVKGINVVIGVSPKTGCLHSWHFGAAGGFGEGDWHFSKGVWNLSTTGTTSEGMPSSATYSLKQLGENKFSIKSNDRYINGLFLPDVDKIELVRKVEVN